MKVYETSSDYGYSFPAVSLAYFLRYPNPYSRHVLSTDVIDRYIDPLTNRLHTTRLHLKRSKVPTALLKLLPSGLAGPGGASQSLIVEKSIIDVREGWMETKSRNMEWTGVLTVVERQLYKRQGEDPHIFTQNIAMTNEEPAKSEDGFTSCRTIVTLDSKLGQGALWKRKPEAEYSKPNFLTNWSTTGLQRTVELIGLKRTREALSKSREGMNVVLERLRNGGVSGVLEGMRKDREAGLGPEAPWRRAWLHGAQANGSDGSSTRDHDR
ncbi:MAG: hypothetical protein Q9227_001461 [Pyrenula ochraceoflavens]